MKTTFEKAVVKVCNCGAPKPHVYFYADPESGERGKFKIPFSSVKALGTFLDSQILGGFISKEQKEEMIKVAQEAGLQEEMDEVEKFLIVPLVMMLSAAFVEE